MLRVPLISRMASMLLPTVCCIMGLQFIIMVSNLSMFLKRCVCSAMIISSKKSAEMLSKFCSKWSLILCVLFVLVVWNKLICD